MSEGASCPSVVVAVVGKKLRIVTSSPPFTAIAPCYGVRQLSVGRVAYGCPYGEGDRVGADLL
eukprot:3443619-Pyramimonas_sp.AAC.1